MTHFTKKGSSTLFLVFAVGAIGLTTGLFVSQNFRSLLQLKKQGREKTGVYVGLTSTLEYFKYAIGNGWCITPSSFLQNSDCDFRDPLNLSRLLLADASEQAIRDYNRDNPSQAIPAPPVGQAIKLNSLIQEVSIDNISVEHPLYKILQALKEYGSRLVLEVKRNTKQSQGREIFLEIKISLKGSKEFFVESRVGYFPRENTFFTLFLNRPLVIGKKDFNPDPTQFKNGAANIPEEVLSNNQAPDLDKTGIKLLSPVYLNNGIYLPRTAEQGEPKTFTRVSFHSPIILGGGKVFLTPNSKFPQVDPFEPLEATEKNRRFQYGIDLPFGGIQRGIVFDAYQDPGLTYLFDPSAPQPDRTLIDKCIRRTLLKTDLLTTADSIFLVKKRGEGASGAKKKFEYILGLSHNNEFVPASKGEVKIVKNDFNDDLLDGHPEIKTHEKRAPLLAVSLKTNKGSLSAHFSKSTQLKIKFKSRAEILIQTGSNKSSQAVSISVSIENLKELPFDDFEIQFFGNDFGGRDNLTSQRKPGTGPNRASPDEKLSTLKFKKDKGTIVEVTPLPRKFVKLDGSPVDFAQSFLPDENLDSKQTDDKCISGLVSQVASLDQSFATTSRFSWNVRPISLIKENNQLIIDENYIGDFLTYSIVDKCIVKAKANLLIGLLTCNELIIEPRNTDLKLIGTFIVDKLNIPVEAFKNNTISFLNLYHPEAVRILRTTPKVEPILSPPLKDDDCIVNSDVPLWTPDLPIESLVKFYQCSPYSLKAKIDPFQWTSINPLCGLPTGATNTQCKDPFWIRNYIEVQFFARQGGVIR